MIRSIFSSRLLPQIKQLEQTIFIIMFIIFYATQEMQTVLIALITVLVYHWTSEVMQ